MIKEAIGKYISLESPYWLQQLYSQYCLIFNTSDIVGRVKKAKFRGFLMKSQWFSARRLEQYQFERLKHLVRYVYQNVPYYHDIFKKNNLIPDDFNSLSDLKKLPILTREDILDNFDRLLSKKAEKKYLMATSTSGSTGTAVSFCRDTRKEYINHSFFDRAYAAIGGRMHWRSVWVRERPFAEKKITAHSIYEPHLNQLTLSMRYSGKIFWEENIDIVKQFKPVYILANPFFLYDLALYAKEKRINDLHFKFIMSAFDYLPAYQRRAVEDQFRCKVYSRYECMERAVSGFECAQQNGFHLDMEKSVVEIIDKDGKEPSRGESGRLIATSLYNFTMPLIRYDVGDIASLSDAPCPCGRGLQLLKSLDGRSSQAIRYRDKILYQSILSFAVMRGRHIRAAQFIQEKEEELLVNIVRNDGFSEDDAQDFVRYLHELADERLRIMIHYVDSIPLTPMGKFPIVISKLGGKPQGQE